MDFFNRVYWLKDETNYCHPWSSLEVALGRADQYTAILFTKPEEKNIYDSLCLIYSWGTPSILVPHEVYPKQCIKHDRFIMPWNPNNKPFWRASCQ